MARLRTQSDGSTEYRFWPKVNKAGPVSALANGNCWIWMAATNGKNGYGIFRGGEGRDLCGSRRWMLVHRFVYEITFGPIPEGLEPDHLCRNRLCVNPSHLELVTHRVNTLRGYSPAANQARRDHCLRGHVFDKRENGGKRRCSICDRVKELRRYERRYGRKPKQMTR